MGNIICVQLLIVCSPKKIIVVLCPFFNIECCFWIGVESQATLRPAACVSGTRDGDAIVGPLICSSGRILIVEWNSKSECIECVGAGGVCNMLYSDGGWLLGFAQE